jgi:hypothetical protein
MWVLGLSGREGEAGEDQSFGNGGCDGTVDTFESARAGAVWCD